MELEESVGLSESRFLGGMSDLLIVVKGLTFRLLTTTAKVFEFNIYEKFKVMKKPNSTCPKVQEGLAKSMSSFVIFDHCLLMQNFVHRSIDVVIHDNQLKNVGLEFNLF